jgi:hypothetical protein
MSFYLIKPLRLVVKHKGAIQLEIVEPILNSNDRAVEKAHRRDDDWIVLHPRVPQ